MCIRDSAYTGREHTCYHVQVPAEGLDTAVDVLVDVVANGSCDPEDVEVERDVVLDELAGRADDPEDLACELVATAALGRDPLARPVIGTEESVEALDTDTLRAFHQRILGSGDVVVAAAGRIDHHALVARIACGPLPVAVARSLPGADAPARPGGSPRSIVTARGRLAVDRADPGWATAPVLVGEDEDSEQALLALARRTPARGHGDRAAAQILSLIHI